MPGWSNKRDSTQTPRQIILSRCSSEPGLISTACQQLAQFICCPAHLGSLLHLGLSTGAAGGALEAGSAGGTVSALIALQARDSRCSASGGGLCLSFGGGGLCLSARRRPVLPLPSPPPSPAQRTSKQTQAPAATWQAPWALQPDGHSTTGTWQGVLGQEAMPGRVSSLSPDGGRVRHASVWHTAAVVKRGSKLGRVGDGEGEGAGLAL